MSILNSLEGLDTKFYELWRFSTKENVSHIKFGQCLYTLIQLIHEDPSLKEVLPLEELLSLSIYHLRELIFKKGNEGVELLPAFYTVYLESICHVCPPLSDEPLKRYPSDNNIEIDNYELIERINQNENLAKSAEEFSKFCKQKRFCILKDKHKKPFVNPIYNQIKKEIDDYTYNNDRLLHFIGKFPKVNGQKDRRGRVENKINLSSSDLIKIELLKLTREFSTQNMKLKFINQYKTVLNNKLLLSIKKIKDIHSNINKDCIKYVVNNRQPVYNDSINTLQLTEDVESIEFSILEFAVEGGDKRLFSYKDRSQTTEDVSDTGFTSSRSYFIYNGITERTEHSFGYGSINELFQVDYEVSVGEEDHLSDNDYIQLGVKANSDCGYVEYNIYEEASDRDFSEDESVSESSTGLCKEVEESQGIEEHEEETNSDPQGLEREITEYEEIQDDIKNIKSRRGLCIQIESATTCSMSDFVMIEDNYRLEEELYEKESCCFGLFNKLKINKWGSRRC